VGGRQCLACLRFRHPIPLRPLGVAVPRVVLSAVVRSPEPMYPRTSPSDRHASLSASIPAYVHKSTMSILRLYFFPRSFALCPFLFVANKPFQLVHILALRSFIFYCSFCGATLIPNGDSVSNFAGFYLPCFWFIESPLNDGFLMFTGLRCARLLSSSMCLPSDLAGNRHLTVDISVCLLLCRRKVFSRWTWDFSVFYFTSSNIRTRTNTPVSSTPAHVHGIY
jgi:hypothetical protein